MSARKLYDKVDLALRLLRAIPSDDIEVCYSGGKDSDVILRLAQMAGIKFTAIYKNTTVDPAGTIKHCKENGVQILQPKQTFYQLIERKGFPTRRCRFCCDKLKEYKIKDDAIQGIRRCESVKRTKLYKEPIICRLYGSKKNHVNVILPILEWTDADVAEFIQSEGIKLHPLYYREDGTVDVTRRLGCMGCPLKSDNGLGDFTANPKLVKEWLKHGKIWWERKRSKPMKAQIKFANIYEVFAHNVFFDSYEAFVMAKNGMFGTEDFKQLLCDYFKINL